MKNYRILAITILLAGVMFSACSLKLGETSTAQTSAEKKNPKKNEKTESGPKSNALNDSTEQDEEWHLEIKRSFHTLEKPEGPPRHGDYSYFKELENGGTVGSLHLFKPREAVFLLWDGEVIAGPLTTVQELEEAYEMLGRQTASEHDLRMDIMKNFPTDRKKRYRTYDADGNLIREDNEL